MEDNSINFDGMDLEENPTIEEILSHPSYSRILNGTVENAEELEALLKSYQTNQRFDQFTHISFICAYSLLIAFGTIGNILVVSVVIRNHSMRTARNMFIINLAISDLFLCIITMPVTLMEILTTYWPFGSSVFICKLFGTFQAVSVYASSFSILAVALDRYHVIVVNPIQSNKERVGIFIVLGSIWIVSCILAAPLFIWRKLVHKQLDFPEIGLSLNFCHEDWPMEYGRAYYSIFTIIFQYLVPVIIVSLAYLGICIKLRYRMKPGQRPGSSRADTHRDNSRVRLKLSAIAGLFLVSWMPLHIINVAQDLTPFLDDNQRAFFIIYGIGHLLSMSSATCDPLLYGFANSSFRKELGDIWSSVLKTCCCRKESNNRGTGGRGSISHRADAEHLSVHYRKSRVSNAGDMDGDIEHSTLITQVLDRQK